MTPEAVRIVENSSQNSVDEINFYMKESDKEILTSYLKMTIYSD